MKAFYKILLSIGIAAGVFCSLIIFAAGQGQWDTLKLQDKLLASDTGKLVINKGSSFYTMSMAYARDLQGLLPEGIISDPVAESPIQTIIYDMEPLIGMVLGTGSNYDKLSDLELIQGRYFTREDVDSDSKVCVLNRNMYDLVKGRNPQFIEINGDEYEIIGVINERKENYYEGFNEGDILVPVTTLYKHILKVNERADQKGGFIWSILYDKQDFSEKQIMSILEDNAKAKGVDITGVKAVPYYYNDSLISGDYFKDLAVLFFISLLILIIASCNIIHLAAASVLDREREIGLRTALGATSGHIMRQITGEILSCVLRGGIAGVAVASVINTIINLSYGRIAFSFNIITVIAGMLLAAAAGLLSALLPAKKAAKLEPAAALREE